MAARSVHAPIAFSGRERNEISPSCPSQCFTCLLRREGASIWKFPASCSGPHIIYNVWCARAPPQRPPLSPVMAEEKDQLKIHESNSDRATVEIGDAIDEKKLLRKLDWHLIPGLTVLFLLSFLDRSNGKPLPSLPPAARSPSLSRKCSHRRSDHRPKHECVFSLPFTLTDRPDSRL